MLGRLVQRKLSSSDDRRQEKSASQQHVLGSQCLYTFSVSSRQAYLVCDVSPV